ncbi:T9SS type A sorting domain-containing protein [Kaistella sp.]|uniref:T9SS type A sorting domain-containing protein n=1 Tax=Kaistella sp. TaxID=2782235 RepID=UPI002F9319D4
MKKILLFLFFTCFSIVYAQNIGDYQSVGSGNWNSTATWQVYNGTAWVNPTAGQYPGNPGGNYAVTIGAGHNVTVSSSLNITTGNIVVKGTLTLNANLTLTGTNQFVIDHGVVFFKKGTELHLPQNSELIIDINSSANPSQGMHPLDYKENECNNNTALYIGLIKYAACSGSGNTAAGTFDEVNSIGGSILAAPFADPIAVCLSDNKPITLLGSVIRSLSTLTPSYSWTLISKPASSGFAFASTTVQSPVIGTLTQAGDYVFELTVTAVFKSRTLTSVKRITVSVDGTTTFDGTLWSAGIPTEQNHRHAVISGSYTTESQGSFSACSCTVTPAGVLTVSGNTFVNVIEKVTNQGVVTQLMVESDGNLIQKLPVPNTGAVTVQRSVTDMDNVLGTAMDYVFWSSPVAGQNLQTFSPGTLPNRIYQYNETNDLFTQASGNFVLGKGYAIQAETSAGYPPNVVGYSKTYEFKGVPHNGDLNVTIKKSPNTGTVDHGYNLLGNPYPSNISFDELYNLNTTVIQPKVWFWTNKIYTPNQQGSSYDGSNYLAYTKGGSNNPGVNGIIKVGQGFIVQKTALGDGTFTFKNMNGTAPVRVADAGTFYQKGSMNRFWLALTSPDKKDNTLLIGYFAGAADGYDETYDAKALSMTPDLFYSVVNDQRLLVQGKAQDFRAADRVPLGANFDQEGNYTIALQQPEGIFTGRQAVYLKDYETGLITNLSEQPYTFAAKAGINEGRFEVLYQPQATPVASGPAKDGIVVYRDGTLYVIRSREKISLLEVYDGAGRMVYAERPGREEISVNSERYPKGVFFFKVHTGGSVITKKVLH